MISKKSKSKKSGKKMKLGVSGGKLKRSGGKKLGVLARSASKKRASSGASARFR